MSERKITLATAWLDGCSGCHMSFLDLDEWLLELAELAEDARVSTLVLTHQVPALDDDTQIGLVFRGPIAAIYTGELVVAADGTTIRLPVE